MRSQLRTLPALLTLALPLPAQQGAEVFRHFHRYPASGQWSTETRATRDGKLLAEPMTSTTCASPLSAARLADIIKLSNDIAPTCKLSTIRDEERTAESEQVCSGPPPQVIHTTLHAVDDTTIDTEVRSAIPGQPETVMQSTSHYLGACTAEQAAEARAAASVPLPSIKPDAEACAQFAGSRKQADDALKNCETADFPADERVTCRSTMSALLQRVQKLQASCGK